MLLKNAIFFILIGMYYQQFDSIKGKNDEYNFSYGSRVFKENDRWYRESYITNSGDRTLSIIWKFANIDYTPRHKKLLPHTCTNSNKEEISYPDTYPSVIEVGAIQMDEAQKTECYVDKKRLSYAFDSKTQHIKQLDEYGVPIIEIDETCSLIKAADMSVTGFNISGKTNLLFSIPAGATLKSSDSAISITTLKALDSLEKSDDFDAERVNGWFTDFKKDSLVNNYTLVRNLSGEKHEISLIVKNTDVKIEPLRFFSYSDNKSYGALGFVSDIYVAK